MVGSSGDLSPAEHLKRMSRVDRARAVWLTDRKRVGRSMGALLGRWVGGWMTAGTVTAGGNSAVHAW